MSDTPVTDAFREVVFAQYKEDELTGDGMGNILAALTDIETLERERDEARELIDDIWITATSDHRFIMPPSKKQIPQHIEGIIKAYDKAHDDWTPEEIKTLMRERDEARERVKELIHENENFYRRLESVHEVYRLSSVCRELKAENEKLKQQQQ